MIAQALSVSPAACDWLQHTRQARVLHVFRRVCNLVNPEGEVLSLVTAAVGAGPFAVVVPRRWGSRLPPDRTRADFACRRGVSTPLVQPSFSDLVDASTAVTVTADGLTVGSLTIHTARARLWQPRPRWERLHRRSDSLLKSLPAIRALLHAGAPSGSLAGLVGLSPEGMPAQEQSAEPAPGVMGTRMLAAALHPARAFCEGLAAGDLEACCAGARGLAGLGRGLTPAGDDFLMGGLIALWATHPVGQAAALAEAVVTAAAPGTTSLSAAWLRAAARGEASAPWHVLVDALASGDGEAARAAVCRILGAGHTSGADALAGFVSVVECVTGTGGEQNS